MRWLLVLLMAANLAHAQADKRRSGFDYMQPSTQALQRDDTQNPAMLWVQDGLALWNKAAGAQQKSCAACHQGIESMRGVAARYPAFDEIEQKPFNLARRINACRTRHQQAPALAWESADLLALEAAVALQSRGLPQQAPLATDRRLAAVIERGRQSWELRRGQLNLACMHCHDQRAGQHLASSVIPQGHAAAYPIYRLEWQAMGSLQRRLRGCLSGVRAAAPAYDADALLELETYLAQRGAGMALETPAVRP